jgi:cation/acetate symporter
VVLLGVISAVAFATILAVVAGLTITAATSFAHDIYANVLTSHQVTEDEQVRVSRITVVVIGILAIGLGILASGQNIAFLVALAFAVAAAANLPTILYTLYWARFNTRGALWSMYGGLISTIVLIVFSPAVSGAKTAMLPHASCRFRWTSSSASSAHSRHPTAAIRRSTPNSRCGRSPASVRRRPSPRTETE